MNPPPPRAARAAFSPRGRRLLCAGLASLLAGPMGSRPMPATAAPAAAPASDPARAEALQLVRDGARLFDAGKYTAALQKFEAAYARFPSPKIQFNIGQASRKLHQPVKSTIAFEAFLRGVAQPTADDRAEAEAAIREMAAGVGRLEIATQPPGASVNLDGAALGLTPLQAPVVVAPGPHDLSLEQAGHQPLRERIVVRGAESKRIDRTLLAQAPPSAAPPPALASPPPPLTGARPPLTPLSWPAPPAGSAAPALLPPTVDLTAAPRSGRRPLVGKVLLGAGLAFATGAVALLIASWSKYNTAKDNQKCGYCVDEADAVDARALWSKVLFGAAGVAGITGATLILLPPAGADAAPAGRAPVSFGFAGHY